MQMLGTQRNQTPSGREAEKEGREKPGVTHLLLEDLEELVAALLAHVVLPDADLVVHKRQGRPGALPALRPEHGVRAQQVEVLRQQLV
jgi:hypothetical protein